MTVTVNHNYPHTGDLRIVDVIGDPIEGVEIRIFELEKFLAGDTTTPTAQTITNSNGEWEDNVELSDSRSWVVHLQKIDVVGPEHREIIT